MSEHTPTPWRFEPNAYGTWFIYEAAKSQITPMGFQISELICGGDGYRTLTEANAAFIVKAVNNHEALVKALEQSCKRLQSFLDTFGDLGDCVTQADLNDWQGVVGCVGKAGGPHER